MRRGTDLRVRLPHLPVRADQVADAVGAPGVRRGAGPVGEADLAADVAKEGKGKGVLLREARVGLDVVEGGAQNLGVLFLEIGVKVAEPAPFPRSTGSVGPRIEPENDVAASVVREAPRRAGVVGHRKVGCGIA